MDTFSIIFGGVIVSFSSIAHHIPLCVLGQYSDFLTTEPAEFTFFIHFEEYQVIHLGIPLFSARNWAVYHIDQGIIIEFGKKGMPSGKFAYTVVFDHFGKSGDIYLNQRVMQKNVPTIELPPLMLDEILAAQILARQDGMIFHACGIQVNPVSGFVFAGVSGSGKTTTARLWLEHSSANLLSDERLVIRKKDGAFNIYSTPWHSPEFSTKPVVVPLTTLFILKHSSTNFIRSLDLTEAISFLLQRTYLPTWDILGMNNSLKFLEELCRAVPCYELGFTPDRQAVEFVQCL